MAALLASSTLATGQRVELYEGGVLWIIEASGKRQKITLSAGAGLDLFAFLVKHQAELKQAAQHDLRELVKEYGPAADFSDHRRGDSIMYRLARSNATRCGTIIWVTATKFVGSTEAGLHYIVAPDADPSTTDVVFPGDVIEQELPSE